MMLWLMKGLLALAVMFAHVFVLYALIDVSMDVFAGTAPLPGLAYMVSGSLLALWCILLALTFYMIDQAQR